MGKTIQDEFTNLPFSRQYKWQLRRIKEKRCHICGRPTTSHVKLCDKHVAIVSAQKKIYNKAYRLERKKRMKK